MQPRYEQKRRTPFIVLEKDPRKVKPEIIALYNDVQDANELTHMIAKFLMALTNVDILDEYKLAVNFINRKLHVSYKWWGKGRDSMTFNLDKKFIAESATRVFSKE
jgi:hypothetical protein